MLVGDDGGADAAAGADEQELQWIAAGSSGQIDAAAQQWSPTAEALHQVSSQSAGPASQQLAAGLRWRWPLVVLTVLSLLTSGACTVSFHAGDGAGSPSAGSVPPLVRDNQAVLDLRSIPTREDVGPDEG